jgi:ribosomal protein S18 acetylase RimI-like enzyme
LTAALALRASAAADHDFLLALFAETRAAELALIHGTDEQRRAFVEMQFRAQDADFRARCPDASFDVVLLDGERVGRLYVDRRADAVHVLDITIASAWRGRGIGTELIARLQAEAAASGRSVTLYAENGGPAHRWYERLGFVADGGQGWHVHLRWEPRSPSRQAKAAS